MDIDKIISVLRSGGLVIAPSDTVYGLLCDGTNEEAVRKLISFKERPAGKAISVFVAGFEMLKNYCEADRQQLETLKQILPGPFTTILNSKHKVSKLLESEKGTLGVRIPSYEFINKLVQKFGRPITATSANLAGRPPVHEVDSLLRTLSAKKRKLIDLVIDIGKLPRNKPSTVINLTTPKIKIIRHGDISLKNKKTHISNSEAETKNIAQKILNSPSVIRNLKIKPIVFILKGELGAGKTIFVKGIGEALGIKNIISPTFVIYYEYDKLIHVDLYNLEDPEEFKHLGLEKYLRPGNILCIEWGEKSEPILKELRNKGELVFVNIKYLDENRREIVCEF